MGRKGSYVRPERADGRPSEERPILWRCAGAEPAVTGTKSGAGQAGSTGSLSDIVSVYFLVEGRLSTEVDAGSDRSVYPDFHRL